MFHPLLEMLNLLDFTQNCNIFDANAIFWKTFDSTIVLRPVKGYQNVIALCIGL